MRVFSLHSSQSLLLPFSHARIHTHTHAHTPEEGLEGNAAGLDFVRDIGTGDRHALDSNGNADGAGAVAALDKQGA